MFPTSSAKPSCASTSNQPVRPCRSNRPIPRGLHHGSQACKRRMPLRHRIREEWITLWAACRWPMPGIHGIVFAGAVKYRFNLTPGSTLWKGFCWAGKTECFMTSTRIRFMPGVDVHETDLSRSAKEAPSFGEAASASLAIKLGRRRGRLVPTCRFARGVAGHSLTQSRQAWHVVIG
jgi:hypothetical protein